MARRYHRRYRRNPSLGRASKYFQGVDMTDIVCAVGGLAASSLLPPLIVKIPTGTEPTTTQKILKILAAAGFALAAGYVAKQFINPNAGKAAIFGGMAGTGGQAISAFTSYKVFPTRAVAGGGIRRIGASSVIAPSYSRSDEQVSFIQP